MKRTFSILIFIYLLIPVHSQESKISVQFRDILFRNLADTLEKVIPVKIYYANKWVDSLYLNIDAENDSLSGILERSFTNSGISFFISDNKLILSKGYNVKTNFSREYHEYLKRSTKKPDSTIYARPVQVPEENLISEEYKVNRIGNPSKNGGDKAVLSGTVTNRETGEPLTGVIIYIDRIKAGAFTNTAGYYSVELPAGQYIVEFRMIGMRQTKRNIMIYSNGSLDVGMVNTTNQLDEVFVSANRENNVQNEKIGIEKIDVKMMKQIPMGMGEADIIKSSLLLPGVQAVSEASGGYNVRGGSTDQNLILFDGAPVINPSHFFGFFSSFNSDVVEDVTLYKSGIPARYGGRISSVMDIALRNGSTEKLDISGGISPFTGRLMVEAPIVRKKASFIVSGRTTYSDWILKTLNDARLRNSSAWFNDLQGLVTIKPDSRNTFTLSAYKSKDYFDYYEMFAIEYSNFSSTARWRHIFSQELSAEFSIIASSYDYIMDSKEDTISHNQSRLKYDLSQGILRSDFIWRPAGNHKVEFGFDGTYFSLIPGTQSPIGSFSQVVTKTLEKEKAIQPSIYISDEYIITPALLVTGGIRLNFFGTFGPKTVYTYLPGMPRSTESMSDTLHYSNRQLIKGYPGIEYRLSSRLILAPNLSVKAGVYTTYQYLNMISNTATMSPIDIWKLSDSYIRPQNGVQFSVGLYKNLKRKAIEASVEVYYKKMNNILDYKGGAQLIMNEHLETDILNGDGKSYGIEFMIRKQYGKLTGWISYTYARVMYRVNGEFEEEKINGGNFFPANFDKPQDLKLVSNIKVMRRFNFSTNVVYNTGRPITYPVAFYNYAGSSRVFFSDRNEFRIPDYLRIDLSATVNGSLKARKLNHSSFTFTVYNLLGRKNPYNIFFKVESGNVNGYQMSIFGQPIYMVTYNFRIREPL